MTPETPSHPVDRLILRQVLDRELQRWQPYYDSVMQLLDNRVPALHSVEYLFFYNLPDAFRHEDPVRQLALAKSWKDYYHRMQALRAALDSPETTNTKGTD